MAALRPGAPRFGRLPAPLGGGRIAWGEEMLAGRVLVDGAPVEVPDRSIWRLAEAEGGALFHDFDWLDDLVATGQGRARRLARELTDGWLLRFGGGAGDGWAPVTLGRRLWRWIDNADLLMGGSDRRDARLRRSLAAQTALAARIWSRAAPGADRIDALAGPIRAMLALDGPGRAAGETAALAAEIARSIAADGSIPERNPERLAGMFTAIAVLRADLLDAGGPVPADFDRGLAAAAPVLRTLRHADGSLARFHGGGGGAAGRLDRALCVSDAPPSAARDRTMGYARLARGRTTLILDAAPPPTGEASRGAHASTLAFELTSGRRPLIVNCGAGDAFGPRWRLAGRATPSHSTLVVDARSSSRLTGEGASDPLHDTPGQVTVERRRDALSTGLVASHDGYVASHGLTHIRQVFLDLDGRGLWGEDAVVVADPRHQDRLDRALGAAGRRLPVRVRFHLHPDVEATEEDEATVRLTLRSGEEWIFRPTGPAEMSLEASVHIDATLPAPRPARQIVLSFAAGESATRVSWTLAKAPQTPDAVRDLVHDGRPVLA